MESADRSGERVLDRCDQPGDRPWDTTALELLMCPVLLHVVDGVPRFVAEAIDELLQCSVTAPFGWSIDEFGVFWKLVAEKHCEKPWAAGRWADVEGNADQSVVGVRLPGESTFAPERLVVREVSLDARSQCVGAFQGD